MIREQSFFLTAWLRPNKLILALVASLSISFFNRSESAASLYAGQASKAVLLSDGYRIWSIDSKRKKTELIRGPWDSLTVSQRRNKAVLTTSGPGTECYLYDGAKSQYQRLPNCNSGYHVCWVTDHQFCLAYAKGSQPVIEISDLAGKLQKRIYAQFHISRRISFVDAWVWLPKERAFLLTVDTQLVLVDQNGSSRLLKDFKGQGIRSIIADTKRSAFAVSVDVGGNYSSVFVSKAGLKGLLTSSPIKDSEKYRTLIPMSFSPTSKQLLLTGMTGYSASDIFLYDTQSHRLSPWTSERDQRNFLSPVWLSSGEFACVAIPVGGKSSREECWTGHIAPKTWNKVALP
jgi:hypothetical protein